MSQNSRRTRVRQLAESVWPGRTVNGYANLIAARLRKLADEESTGMLPVAGRGDGAVFFRGGKVVYAESSRTSLPSLRTSGLAALGLTRRGASLDEGHPGEAGLVAARSVSRLTGMLELTELIIDALAELLSTESRYAKFRPAEVLPVGQGRPMPVEPLLAEVQRRHEVLRQLAAILTPDTAVARHPSLDPPAAQVSPTQWSLLARADGDDVSRPGHAAGPERLRHHDRGVPAARARAAGRARSAARARRRAARHQYLVHTRRVRRERQRCVTSRL